MVQVSIVSRELSVEDKFKNELYKKYESLWVNFQLYHDESIL
jgi:hypothetical protein